MVLAFFSRTLARFSFNFIVCDFFTQKAHNFFVLFEYGLVLPQSEQIVSTKGFTTSPFMGTFLTVFFSISKYNK
jgi:hypothetical protein